MPTGSRCLRPPGSRALYLAEGAGRAHPPWHLLALGSPLAPRIPLGERSRQPGPPRPSLPPRDGVWWGPAWPPSVWSREGTERASASNSGPRWVTQGKPPSSRPSRARVPLKPTPKAAGQPRRPPREQDGPTEGGQGRSPPRCPCGQGREPSLPPFPAAPSRSLAAPSSRKRSPVPFPSEALPPKPSPSCPVWREALELGRRKGRRRPRHSEAAGSHTSRRPAVLPSGRPRAPPAPHGDSTSRQRVACVTCSLLTAAGCALMDDPCPQERHYIEGLEEDGLREEAMRAQTHRSPGRCGQGPRRREAAGVSGGTWPEVTPSFRTLSRVEAPAPQGSQALSKGV